MSSVGDACAGSRKFVEQTIEIEEEDYADNSEYKLNSSEKALHGSPNMSDGTENGVCFPVKS
jgi:hypothetical protein